VTRGCSDRDGLQLQVYAGRDPLTGRKRWVSRPVPGKGRAASKRAKQVGAELLARAAGQHCGSRPKTVAELIELVVGGAPGRPADLASHHRRVPGCLDRSICRASPRSRSRPAGAAILDAFYARLRAQGGRAGRPLAPS
jgi:hypothetical protein